MSKSSSASEAQTNSIVDPRGLDLSQIAGFSQYCHQGVAELTKLLAQCMGTYGGRPGRDNVWHRCSIVATSGT